ncbi:MAG: 23S rRNA (adenine(2503)-C(2))-methyltransferase RlmN [Synergistetes bacterium HGW-Synergistetes-1]|nr:MAG: 23S rRNA (adenine(2503)-C(2))-methyltransferase RlmN [Synergistetes bacterium HGW-Synergistetes-1]
MTDKIYALDLDNSEWSQILDKEFGEPRFRADQICQWIWQKRAFDVAEMTNLSKTLRDLLESKIDFGAPLLIKEQRSSIDGTRKYLWQLRDGQSVESVLMRQGERLTACISTQVGCPLGCTFCATGLSGYVRNLSAGEIAGQFLAMERSVGRDINNAVYMGMGEPFLNTEAVLKSVRMLNDPDMRNLGIRHIAISTSGIVPGIRDLAASGLGVRLAVSLHAADDDLRSSLMPVNETFPLDELRKAMQEYQKTTGNRITIEYALFGGINDSVEHARLLLRYLKGIHVFINLIPFNQVDGRYEKPSPENILKFRSVLVTAGFEAEIREELGSDIDAACGQLRRKTMAGDPCILEPGPKVKPAFEAKKKESRAPKREASDPRRTSGPSRGKSGSDAVGQKREKTERAGTKASGGFVEERGAKRPASEDKRRKTDAPPKERYRSGKMKEERPSYRAGSEGQSADRPSRTDEKKKSDTTRAAKRSSYRAGSEGQSADRPSRTDEKKKSGTTRAAKRSSYRAGSEGQSADRPSGTDEKKESGTTRAAKRPSYRAGSEGQSADRPSGTDEKKKRSINKSAKKPVAAGGTGRGKPVAESRKKKPRTATKDNRQKRS